MCKHTLLTSLPKTYMKIMIMKAWGGTLLLRSWVIIKLTMLWGKTTSGSTTKAEIVDRGKLRLVGNFGVYSLMERINGLTWRIWSNLILWMLLDMQWAITLLMSLHLNGGFPTLWGRLMLLPKLWSRDSERQKQSLFLRFEAVLKSAKSLIKRTATPIGWMHGTKK